MDLKKEIENYIPYNEQEEIDKKYFLDFIDKFDDVLTRNNQFGHFTASAFVVNKEKTKMVVVYHIINDGWIYPGGHADGEEDLLSVAVREVEEETGLKATPLDKEIFAINANAVNAHIKKGKFVASHIHYDVVYLLEADDSLPLTYKEDESNDVKWIDLEDADSDEIINFMRPVHNKLVKKLKRI